MRKRKDLHIDQIEFKELQELSSNNNNNKLFLNNIN